MEQENDSLERALADIEMISAAYQEEVSTSVRGIHNDDELAIKRSSEVSFPLQWTIHLTNDATITLEVTSGYPTKSGIQVLSYRSKNPIDKQRMETTIAAIRNTSNECQQDGIEGGFACCSIALETWNDFQQRPGGVRGGPNEADDEDNQKRNDNSTQKSSCSANAKPAFQQQQPEQPIYQWTSGKPLVDRKSTFQAHLCHVSSEIDVQRALYQLVTGSSKIQRATHNIYAWRVHEVASNGSTILKHDNNDDGEDAAGSKLAFLLDMRKDVNVLVVVSRWYGGIHLGPKRFAHIVNVARELLVAEISSTSTTTRHNDK